MTSYYVRWKGQVTGPFSPDDLRAMVKKGLASKHHQISTNRLEWVSLVDSDEFRADCVTKTPKLKLKSGSDAAGNTQPGVRDPTVPIGVLVGQGNPQHGIPSDAPIQAGWYYTDAAGVQGPLPRAQIQSLLASGAIQSETPVCAEGAEVWQHAGDVFGGTPSHMAYLPGRLQATGGGGASGVTPRNIRNYLVQSILVTLFCCLPFGIPAIVYASQVNSRIQAGDVQGAIDSSNKANMWGWLGFGVGLVAQVAYGVFLAVS